MHRDAHFPNKTLKLLSLLVGQRRCFRILFFGFAPPPPLQTIGISAGAEQNAFGKEVVGVASLAQTWMQEEGEDV